jgi:hypothetical protein
MGKRSRKRTGSSAAAATDDDAASGGTTRAERDAARARRVAGAGEDAPAKSGSRSTRASAPARRRSVRGERPPPPWGNFPLVEICVLLAIVLLVGGFVVGGKQGATMILAGLAVGSLAGLELAIREHFAGFKSHSTVLSGAVALTVATLVAVLAGGILLPVLVGIALLVFAACFYVFRNVFRRRSGGL